MSSKAVDQQQAGDLEAGAGAARAKNEASKKLQEDMTHLTAAKDRAQLSSASAMSILDVGVLGEVIRRGSTYSMYVPLLVMVSVALFLQLVVGVLSLMISNMKNHYTKFGSAGRRNCCLLNCFRSDTEPEGTTASPAGQVIADARTVNGGDIISITERAELVADGEDVTDFYEDEVDLPDGVLMADFAPNLPSHVREHGRGSIVAIKPSLCQIYGSRPTGASTEELDYARVPAPYETCKRDADSKTKRPRSFEDKSVARLGAWVEKMLETKERHIETRANILFLEREISQCSSKLEGLNRDREELNIAEISLCEELATVEAQMDKLFVYVQQEKQDQSLYESKMEELADMERSPPADDAENRRLKLQQEIREIQQRIELCKVKGLDCTRAKLKRVDVENRMRLHSEAKKRTTSDIRQVEAYLRAIKEEQERQMKQRRWFEIHEEKFKLYHNMVDDVEKTKVLKHVMNFQNVINYILYFVFILNLFITTFSLLSDDK